MFDTFDVLVPALRTTRPVEIRQHQTAFGPDETRRLFVRDIELGRVVSPDEAFRGVPARSGPPGCSCWAVLSLSKEANLAANSDDNWTAYLGALRTLLAAHPQWKIICESDCDQHPVHTLELTLAALVKLLDSYRTTKCRPIAFCAASAEQ